MSDDPTAKLADRYDREAREYRDLWAPILHTPGIRLLRHIPAGRVRRVLDVGTGVGSLLPDLRSAFPEASVIGVDRSRGMIVLAPADGPRAVMDATRLALASGSMDVVLMIFMLFHLGRPDDGLREACRVLRRGGRLGAVTWGGELDSTASRIWADCLDSHGAAAAEPPVLARHEAMDTPEKLEGLLRDAGFSEVRSWWDELIATIDSEHLVGLRTQLGSSKPRFDSLGPPAQEACIAAARLKMKALAPEDFVSSGKIVFAVARA